MWPDLVSDMLMRRPGAPGTQTSPRGLKGGREGGIPVLVGTDKPSARKTLDEVGSGGRGEALEESREDDGARNQGSEGGVFTMAEVRGAGPEKVLTRRGGGEGLGTGQPLSRKVEAKQDCGSDSQQGLTTGLGIRRPLRCCDTHGHCPLSPKGPGNTTGWGGKVTPISQVPPGHARGQGENGHQPPSPERSSNFLDQIVQSFYRQGH